MSRSRHAKLVGVVEKNAREVLSKHGLKDEYLTVREVRFPHGRADLVLYGVYEGLSVIPIAVEVRDEIVSATDILNTINKKMKGLYDYSFTHTYLAVPDVKGRVEDFLSGLGYGLIKVEDEKISIAKEAKPRKPLEEDYYYRVVSRGLLYLAVKRALEDNSLEVNHISSEWIGYEKPINYCGWLSRNHAVFGVYARDPSFAKKLLDAADTSKLAEAGYRTHIEIRFLAAGHPIGTLHLCNQPLTERISKDNILKLMKTLKKEYKPCGVGLSIYKPLWSTNTAPSYAWALGQVRKCLSDGELGTLKSIAK